MARRGFIAELNHQIKLEAQRQARTQREAERQRAAAIREAERARKQEERAAKALQRAQEADRKRLEKEAREAHIAAMEAKVVELNANLASIYSEIDSLLEATLDVDDYVDLETLRAVTQHEPFDRAELERPAPAPTPPTVAAVLERPLPTPPQYFRVFARKRYKAYIAEYERQHALLLKQKAQYEAARAAWEQAETIRIATLKKEKARYEQECRSREAETKKQNEKLDALIANLGYGTPDAVEEYVSIVLSNSVYPPDFSIEHEFEFDVTSAELKLRVLVPGPEAIPTIKMYRYQKSTDEIVSSNLAVKACKDRYASALHQVALRSVHEVFEADRRGIVKTISLEVSTATINRATGNHEVFCLVAVGADRESFLSINLANVAPEATLNHLGAAISKNPYELVAVNKNGVRRS